MSTGMTEVTARVAQLRSMMGLAPAGVLGGEGGAAGTSSTSAAAFSDTLGRVLGTGGSAGSTGSAGGTAGTGQQAVALARSYLGVPYLWGGTDPSRGLDCSGLVQLVFRKLGVELPRVAADQSRSGVQVPSLAAAQPGDLVFFGSPAHHVGIYVGSGQMIDAPHTGSTVGVHAIAGYGPVSQIRRVTGPTSAATASAATASAATASAASALSTGALQMYLQGLTSSSEGLR